MKRAILAVLAALLLTAPVNAAPPADTATLTVVSVEASCPHPLLSNRGCITFQSEPDKANGGPNRHVIEVAIQADWACGFNPGPGWSTCMSESGTVEIDADGLGVYFFRNGSSGTPGETFSAYVARYGSRSTPISPVVTGSLP